MRKSSILIISAILILGCGQSKGGNETSRTNRATVQELESTNRTVELTAQPSTLKISELPDSITV